jgi:hypothetical protein
MVDTSRRREWKRRVVPALVIVVVGLLLAWWGSDRERQRIRQVRDDVQRMFLNLQTGGSVVPLASDPLIGREVESRLATVMGQVADPSELQIDLVPGDAEGYGMSLATHRATIGLQGTPIVGLRLLHRDGDTTIVGYWDPAR